MIMKPHTQLIVNADDFGLSDSINTGIIEAHRQGIVTSTTLLANGPAFDQGVRLLHQNPNLGVGVHLNVLRGRPVTDPTKLPNLTKNGRFHLSWSRILQTCNRLILDEIEMEYRAQIEKIASQNITITHLDGEKHHHQFPPIFKRVARLMTSHQIHAVRCAPEPLNRRYGLTKMAKVSMLNLLVWRNQHLLQNQTCHHAHRQIGIAMTGGMEINGLQAALNTLVPGINELCCHPGYVNQEHKLQTADFGTFYIDSTREGELRSLTDPTIRQLLADAGVTLITYAEATKRD